MLTAGETLNAAGRGLNIISPSLRAEIFKQISPSDTSPAANASERESSEINVKVDVEVTEEPSGETLEESSEKPLEEPSREWAETFKPGEFRDVVGEWYLGESQAEELVIRGEDGG
eukprot:663141_1